MLGTTPGDGSTQVALDADVRIRFSEALDCSSVTPDAFTVVETFDVLVAARRGSASTTPTVTVTCVGDTVDVALGALDHTSEVTVALAGTVRSARATLSGGSLNDGAGHAFAFTTEDPLDRFLANALPANGSTGIPVDTAVGLTFSEPIDCATITPAGVVVTEALSSQFLQQNPGSPATITQAVSVDACSGAEVSLDFTDDFQLASRVTVTLPGSFASARATVGARSAERRRWRVTSSRSRRRSACGPAAATG